MNFLFIIDTSFSILAFLDLKIIVFLSIFFKFDSFISNLHLPSKYL